MKRITSVANEVGRGVGGLVLVASLCLGCSSSPTDPGPVPVEVTVTFTPLNPNVSLVVGEVRAFTANVTGTEIYTVSWRLGGTEVGTGSLYTYEGRTVGPEELAVAVSAGETAEDRTWDLLVEANKSELPAVVTGLVLDHGPAPAEVKLNWWKDESGTYPLAGYQVALSYAGPVVDEVTWAAADEVVPTGVGDAIQQELLLDAVAHDIRSGESVWFAVRALDDRGQLSEVAEISPWLEITSAWMLELTVRDDTGEPVSQQLVEYVCTNCGTAPVSAGTPDDGMLSLGPFRSIDTVVVATNSADDTGGDSGAGWFDYTTPPWDMSMGPLEIVLINRWGISDLAPCADYADFMDYIVHMSRRPVDLPVYRWETLPLRVYAETFDDLGTDLGPWALEAVTAWDTALGEGVVGSYLVTTSDPNQADILIEFADLVSYGLTSLLEPAGDIGTVVPQKVSAAVTDGPVGAATDDPYGVPGEPGYPDVNVAAVIAMHELGHALCLLGHSCSGALMADVVAPELLAGLDPSEFHTAIAETESRAVRALLRLPQGVALEGYE